MVILDIDHFGLFNKDHGLLAGDAALATVTRTLASEVRDVDVLARYGGEEIAVIMPGQPLEDGRLGAERLRAAVAGRQFAHGALTVSAGVAPYNHGSLPEDVIEAASVALNAAKKAGRNRVEVFQAIAAPTADAP